MCVCVNPYSLNPLPFELKPRSFVCPSSTLFHLSMVPCAGCGVIKANWELSIDLGISNVIIFSSCGFS